MPTGALLVVLLMAIDVSGTRYMRTKPVAKQGDMGQKLPTALLRKDSIAKAQGEDEACAEPACGPKVSMVLKVNNVLVQAQEVEKKAEKLDTDAKKMIESAVEVKAAKKGESSAVAEEVAAKEKVEIVKTEVKKEETEISEKEQVVQKEKEEAKAIVSPEAKKIVQKDEAAMEDEIKEEEIEAEMKKEEEKTTEQKAAVVKMKTTISKAAVVAKQEDFKAEEKAIEKEKKLADPKAIFKIELAVYNVQKQIVKDAKKAPPAGPPKASDEVKEAELPKVNLATAMINTAKTKAKEAEIEEKKAEVVFKENKDEAKTEAEVAQVVAPFQTVEKLEEVLEKCEPCKPAATAAAAAAKQVVKKCTFWDFVAMKNSDLTAIKMGPSTGTKMTEVHTLGKGSNYKNWVLQVGTGLHLTSPGQLGAEWDFAAMPNGDLMGIKMGPTTGSKKTEVHILSKSSNYAKFNLHAATGLGLTTHKEWDFVAAPNGDLMCIKKGPTTGSGKTEVHILSKSSNYASFNLHAASGLELSSGPTEWDFAAMPNGDLMCIKMGPTTGSAKTEVHILSKSSNFKTFVLHAATGLGLTTHKDWSFAAMPNGDLMCIKKGPTTGTKTTEVHILSKSSNYAKWVLQTGTGLGLTVEPPGVCS